MVRVRFAPSPTGYIHIGNARTALFNSLLARSMHGTLVLRVEDTDAVRSKRAYEEALYDDLRWLGIEWQEGPDIGGPYGPYRQSERTKLYQEHVDRLLKDGHAYYCYCTKDEIESARAEALRRKKPPRYNNRCRTLSAEEAERRKTQGIKPVVRFKIQEPQLVVHDLIRGDIAFDLDQMVGDFIIVKYDGLPTFHLAVCVDDGLMKITHVLRGEDHLPNTPRHVLLFKALGFEPPKFAHMSLTASSEGGLLSKREGATSIRAYREQGYPSDGVVNYLSLLGWSSSDNEEIFSPDELVNRFDLSHMRKASAMFDRTKLEWVSGMHMRRMSDAAFTEKAFSYLCAHGLEPGKIERDPEWFAEAVLLFKDGIHHFSALFDQLMIFDDPMKLEAEHVLEEASAAKVIGEAVRALETLSGDEEDFWPAWMAALKKHSSVKGKALFMPIRAALTGRDHGPELRRTAKLLGKARCLARLRHAGGRIRTASP